MDSDTDADAAPDTDDPGPDRIDYDRLADRVLDRIEPASVVGDRVVLSRRQAIALGTGATSLAALGLFSGEASADVVGQVGTSADRVDVFAGAVDANSVSTAEASVTNESLIFGTRGTDTSSISAATYANIIDGTAKDVRGEVSAAQYTPDKSGTYLIVLRPAFGGNTTAGDQFQTRIQDVSASTTVNKETGVIKAALQPISNTYVEELSAGTTYEFQARNNNNSFTVEANLSGIKIAAVLIG